MKPAECGDGGWNAGIQNVVAGVRAVGGKIFRGGVRLGEKV